MIRYKSNPFAALGVKQTGTSAAKNKGGEKGVQRLLEGQRYFVFTKIQFCKQGQAILRVLFFQAACTAHFLPGKDYLQVTQGADLVYRNTSSCCQQEQNQDQPLSSAETRQRESMDGSCLFQSGMVSPSAGLPQPSLSKEHSTPASSLET